MMEYCNLNTKSVKYGKMIKIIAWLCIKVTVFVFHQILFLGGVSIFFLGGGG